MIQSEFLIVIHMKMPELADLVRGMGWNSVMRFKREFQQALTVYARHHSMDRIQEKAVAMMTKIEKWARNAFVEKEMLRIRSGTNKTLLTAKHEARQAWEVYNRKESY